MHSLSLSAHACIAYMLYIIVGKAYVNMCETERHTCNMKGRMYLWYQADMNVGKVRRTTPKLKLSESLDKWHSLNITNGTTKLERMKS